MFPNGALPSDTIRKRTMYYVNISVMNRASYSVGQECEHGDWNCKRCGKNHLVPRTCCRVLQGHSVNKKVAQTHEQCNFLKNKKVAI